MLGGAISFLVRSENKITKKPTPSSRKKVAGYGPKTGTKILMKL